MTKETVRPGSAGRLLFIAAVTVLVVLGAVLVDRAIHDPPCRDGAAAEEVVAREVLPALEELPVGEDYALEAGEPETVGESLYYPVAVFAGQDEPPVLTVYVRTRDSRPFLRDGTTGQLIPCGG